MVPLEQRDHPILRGWLGGTTCGLYAVHRSILLENSAYIVLKHGSHQSWCGRFTGNLTCCSYAALYRKSDLETDRYALSTGQQWIKKWEGRISLKKVRADCTSIGLDSLADLLGILRFDCHCDHMRHTSVPPVVDVLTGYAKGCG